MLTPLQKHAVRRILELSQSGYSATMLNEETRVKNYKRSPEDYLLNKILGEDTRNPWKALGHANADFSIIEMYIGMILEEEHKGVDE